MIYASSGSITAKETGNTAVSLSFKHILSKVNTKFKSGFDPDFTIEISEVEFRNIYDKADFSSNGDSWSNASRTVEMNEADKKWTKITLPITGTDNSINSGAAADGDTEAVAAKELTTDYGYFLPVTYSSNNVTLSFKITVKQGTDVIKSDYVKGNIKPTWAAGSSYTYNVTVNGSAAGVEKIEFSVDATNGIQDWTEVPPTDFNFGA